MASKKVERKVKRAQSWKLPPVEPIAPAVNGESPLVDGEPFLTALTRFEDESNVLQGNAWVVCCDCGLCHNWIFTVYRAENGNWYLKQRTYRVPGTGRDARDTE